MWKNNYDIVDVYNDAGHSGKDLMRPEMQRLLKDIKSHKIENLNKKKQQIDPNNDLKEYIIELLKKLDCSVENGKVISNSKIAFTFIFNSLKRKTKQELIDYIEIKRDKNYDIKITNVKFTEEFISKSSKEYIKYLYEILQNNNIGFIYKEAIDSTELEKLKENYFVFSDERIGEYSKEELEKYVELLQEHFYTDGVINCPYIENGNMIDNLTLIPKDTNKRVEEEANYEAS